MRLCGLFGCRGRSSRAHRTMIRRVAMTPLLVSASLFVFLSQAAEAQTSIYEQILAKKNIGTDPPSLARVLLELSDPARRQSLGANGRRAVEEQYNWPRDESKLLDVVNAC